MSESMDKLQIPPSVVESNLNKIFLSFVLTSLFWLLMSGLSQLVLFAKFLYPEFLNTQNLSFGRILAVSDILEMFGCYLFLCIIAVSWLCIRGSNRPSRFNGLLWFSLSLWNAGVLVGVGKIILIGPNSFFQDHLSLTGKLLISMASVIFAVWFIANFVLVDGFETSVRFTLAALVWVMAIFLPGAFLIQADQLNGMVEVLTSQWISSGVKSVCLQFLTLGLIAALIENEARSLRISSSRSFQVIWFWMFVLLGPLSGISRLATGPLPLWAGSISAAAGILLIIPVIGMILDLYKALANISRPENTLWVGCVKLSLGFYACYQTFESLSAFRGIDLLIRFSLFEMGASRLFSQGFIGLTVFGACYFIINKIFPHFNEVKVLKRGHLLLCSYGCGVVSLLLILCGFLAGSDLLNHEIAFAQVLETYSFFSVGLFCAAIVYFAGLALFAFDIAFGWLRARL